MASTFYISVLITVILALAVCDIRTRTVPLWLLVAYGVMVLAYERRISGIRTTMLNAVQSLAVLAVLGGGLLLYCAIRYQNIRQIAALTGIGDALFLTFTAPLFGAKEFTMFLIASCLVGLLWATAQTVLAGRKNRSTGQPEPHSVAAASLESAKNGVPFIATAAIVLVPCVLFRIP